MTELFSCFIAFMGIERDLRKIDEMLYKEDSK